ncbi:MAG: hypothetical protein SFV54_03840 [Bryobacteraceae bacterium]|nr:hypothetical protein [Bryobacteraceae bacterium]
MTRPAMAPVIPALSLILMTACTQQPSAPRHITATSYNSGFPQAHDSYNAMGAAADGPIYYVLSSEQPDIAGRMYRFDPATQKIEPLADLTEVAGEKDKKAIAQGKSHVNFVEDAPAKTLYFATHIGYYSIIDGMEKMGVPPAGMQPYPGGHLLAFNTETRQFTDFGVAPEREGILTMNMDVQRKRIYGLTWPTGYFFRYDIPRQEWKNLGPVAGGGENGAGTNYQTICRSIAIDPRDGAAYFTDSTGAIHRYRYTTDALELVQRDNLRKDYFGQYDPHSAGHMGYNWRQTFWHPSTEAIYGVHGNSGYLFKFDPKAETVDVLTRLTSHPSQRAGMFDQFSYGYLGFALGPDGRTIHYLTGGPIYENGRRVKGKDSTAKGESKGRENLHLVTYDLARAEYRDHGPIFYENGDRPEYVNSIAVGKDGVVYTLARIAENGKLRADLVAIPAPRLR